MSYPLFNKEFLMPYSPFLFLNPLSSFTKEFLISSLTKELQYPPFTYLCHILFSITQLSQSYIEIFGPNYEVEYASGFRDIYTQELKSTATTLGIATAIGAVSIFVVHPAARAFILN